MIKYSNGNSFTKNNNVASYKNRGLGFEHLINVSNKYYKENNVALIYKKPTPIKIIKTNKSSDNFRITEAIFESPSTTDYNGIFNGRYIDFEAKETLSKTSFPFSNIHPNQIDHLIKANYLGGICFLLISFKNLSEVYLFPAEKLKMYIENQKKSISIDEIKNDGFLVPSTYINPINYLEIVEQFLM